MAAAAYTPSVERTSDWLEELERILKGFDAIPSAARDAVRSVVESLVHDPDTTDAEIGYASALLADHAQRLPEAPPQRRSILGVSTGRAAGVALGHAQCT